MAVWPGVIVDVDGTLIDFLGYPIPEGVAFCRRHHAAGRAILIVTAREQRWRKATVAWLKEHLPVPFEGPWHRRDGDVRADSVVKSEIWQCLSESYDITAAIDDLPENLALWERIGISEVESVPAEAFYGRRA